MQWSPNLFFEDVLEKDDESFDKSVEGFAMSALNQGEVCTAPSRALVQASIYDKFMERAVKRVKNTKTKQSTRYRHHDGRPSLIGANGKNSLLLRYWQAGRCAVPPWRGKAVVGSDVSGGYYVQPTIFKGHNKMRIFQEEVFGPVVAVTMFKDEAESSLSATIRFTVEGRLLEP